MEYAEKGSPESAESQPGISAEPNESTQVGDAQSPQERLERVEAALGLLLNHMQTATRGSEILEAEHSRNLLSSIAFGFSSISLIALWSIDLASEDVDLDLLRFTVGMALILFASVTDLWSASLLRKAVNKAVLEKEPSQLVLWQRSWRRLFDMSYWEQIRVQSTDFYVHQIARTSALAIYVIAGVFLIWAVFTLD